MKNLIYISVIFIVFLLVVVPSLLCLGLKYVPSGFQPSLDYIEQLDKKRSIEQEFKAEDKNLTAIGMSIKNPNLANKKEVILEIFKGKEPLRKVIISGRNISDGGFIKLNFEPIVDSKNNDYIFRLSSPDTEGSEALGIFMTEKSKDKKDVSFVTFYNKNKVDLIVEVYKNFFSRLFSDWIFATFYLMLVFVTGFIGIKNLLRIKE